MLEVLQQFRCNFISGQILGVQDPFVRLLAELLPHRFFHPAAPRRQLWPLLKEVIASTDRLQRERATEPGREASCQQSAEVFARAGTRTEHRCASSLRQQTVVEFMRWRSSLALSLQEASAVMLSSCCPAPKAQPRLTQGLPNVEHRGPHTPVSHLNTSAFCGSFYDIDPGTLRKINRSVLT